jgi:hypothetical protein
MSLMRPFFPQQSRTFPGKRWLNISLRTLHLIGVAGLGGAYLYAAPKELWEPYLWLSLGSGVALVTTSLYSNGIWLLQLRGLLILFKLGLLGAMLWLPGFSLQLGVTVIVLSSVIAHAPGNVRYYSIWHRRRIENL